MGIEVFNYECAGQMSLTDYLSLNIPLKKIDRPVRLIELFGGVGSQAMALRDLGIDFETYRLVEYDKYPVASYNAIHGTDFKPTDITKIHAEDLGIVERGKYEYIMTYSFPCQDISVAGLGKSLEKGSGTRSGLLWEVERLLNECGNELPQILLMENVKNLLSSKHKEHFDKWCEYLESKGYKNFYKVMNAKNFGVAQNRERVFMVSLLGNYKYEFPEEIPLKNRMKDYLESEVDKKYYITTDKARTLIDKLILGGKILTDRQTDRQSTCALISQEQSKEQTALKHDTMTESVISDKTEPECAKQLGFIEKGTGKHQSNTVYSSDCLSPCMNAVNWKEPIKVVECKKIK